MRVKKKWRGPTVFAQDGTPRFVLLWAQIFLYDFFLSKAARFYEMYETRFPTTIAHDGGALSLSNASASSGITVV